MTHNILKRGGGLQTTAKKAGLLNLRGGGAGGRRGEDTTALKYNRGGEGII